MKESDIRLRRVGKRVFVMESESDGRYQNWDGRLTGEKGLDLLPDVLTMVARALGFDAKVSVSDVVDRGPGNASGPCAGGA